MLTKPKNIPTTSGVYQFLDAKGKPIYIGKASNLKNRLGSYFRKNIPDKRIRDMVENAKKVEWAQTQSDIEALIQESKLIKQYKPRFNVMLRDDKQYFYVGISKEDWPRITITHQPKNTRNFIGPFTDGTTLKTTLKLLRKIFPYCTCKNKHNRYCLNYHIDNCFGDCCLKEPNNKQRAQYKKNIKAIKDILTGKRTILKKRLVTDLKVATAKEDFEKAIGLRDQIVRLERFFDNTSVIRKQGQQQRALRLLKKNFALSSIPHRIEGYDISNVQGLHATGSMVVFEDGVPNKNEYRRFNIKTKSSPDDTAMLKEILKRRAKHDDWPWPDLILIDGGKAQLNAAISSIKNAPIISLAKGRERKGNEVFATTLEKPIKIQKLPASVIDLIKFIDGEAHRFAINYYRTLHRHSVKKRSSV